MSEPNDTLIKGIPPKPSTIPSFDLKKHRTFFVVCAGLVLAFGRSLYDLVRYSLNSELYSHIVLIPIVSGYLVWLQRKTLSFDSKPDPRLAILPFVGGLAALMGFWLAVLSGAKLSREDSLALTTFSFLLLLVGTGAVFFGKNTLRAVAFPIAFLVFMVPMPSFLVGWIETFLQHGSAIAALGFFRIVGTPLFRDELIFQLPGITLQVAPQCSGIHSTLALFITSLIAGQMFLRSPWKRAVLTLAVIPLALLRNGFRIFTIGELCVHVSPAMINSYVHHHGGPIFFALSLIPFSLLLFYLVKSDRRMKTAG